MTNPEQFDQEGKKQAKKQTIFKEELPAIVVEETSVGLEQNLAAALCHIPIIGLIFFLMEKKNKFVRFHALQVIILSIALVVVGIGISIFTGLLSMMKLGWLGWLMSGAFYLLAAPVSFFLLIYMGYQAYQGKMFKLPMIGKMAEEHSQPK